MKAGKTPVLAPEEARALIDSIDITTRVGLRDRALIGLMVFSFAHRRCARDESGRRVHAEPPAIDVLNASSVSFEADGALLKAAEIVWASFCTGNAVVGSSGVAANIR